MLGEVSARSRRGMPPSAMSSATSRAASSSSGLAGSAFGRGERALPAAASAASWPPGPAARRLRLRLGLRPPLPARGPPRPAGRARRVALERAQLGREAPGVLAQALHQAAELVVERADPLEQLARGGRDPVDVLARLLAGLGAQLLGRRLGRLDDPLDLRGRRGRDGRAPRRRSPSSSSASSRRCASTAPGS